jgi:ABC-type antimicrobial peptide transport system permease subunit
MMGLLTDRTLGVTRGALWFELENDVRKAIAVVDPDQPVLLSASMESFVADSVADRRFIMALLTVSAVLALVIAAAGIYGVTLFATSRKTQEIGIRIALGATSGNIHRLIFRQGFMPIGLGLGTGLVLSLALMRILHGLIAGLDSANPLRIAAAALVATTAAALVATTAAACACWIPTRRATTVDPVAVLRDD